MEAKRPSFLTYLACHASQLLSLLVSTVVSASTHARYREIRDNLTSWRDYTFDLLKP